MKSGCVISVLCNTFNSSHCSCPRSLCCRSILSLVFCSSLKDIDSYRRFSHLFHLIGEIYKSRKGNIPCPGRSTQWWLTNRVRRTSLALWDRAKWTCRISLHPRGAHRFWCRRVRSMSTCAYIRQLLLVFDVSWRAETTVMGRIIITVDDWLVQSFKERGISGNRAILVLSCDHAAFLIHYSQGGRVVNTSQVSSPT